MVRETNFAAQLIELSRPLTPADRTCLARASIATALDCLRASPPDVGAARAFVMDALAQIERAGDR